MTQPPEQPLRSKLQSRGRPRANTPRLSEAMVRPTFKTFLRQMVRNGKLGALILLITGLWAIWYAFRSDRFMIRNIEVVGARSLEREEITALAGLDERSIWFVEPELVAAAVAQNAYVQTATVNLLLPDTAVITLQEREAAIIWQSGGQGYEVTAQGEVLGTGRITDTTNVLIIYDTRNSPLEIGSYIDADALDLVQTLNLRIPAEMGWTPQRYEWDPYYGVSVYYDSRQIVFGRLADAVVPLDQKLATVDTLMTDGTVWTFLDVRSGRPYYQEPAVPTPTVQP